MNIERAMKVEDTSSTPQEWVRRCAARLRLRVTDMDVREQDLLDCAADLVEDPGYNKLSAEAAAEQWVHDTR